MTSSERSGEVDLPSAGIDLCRDLVPAMRTMLGRGLSKAFMRSCVRIGGFEPFSGGFRADLVGGLTIHVNAVLKLGGEELDRHQSFMRAVNGVRPQTFPDVLELVPLPDNKRLMLMEQLRGYGTVFDWIYARETGLDDLGKVLGKAIEAVAALHTLAPGDPRAPACRSTPDPYSGRFDNRLAIILAKMPELATIMERPGMVMGVPCPPISMLLARVKEWLAGPGRPTKLVLVHGDPHLRNTMVRRYGRGLKVRLIDPNPDIGFTDPLYDFGKLLHMASTVGYADVMPALCSSDWSTGTDTEGWRLDARLTDPPTAVEERRRQVERRIGEVVERTLSATGESVAARTLIALASAHISLVATLAVNGSGVLARFGLAQTLEPLARWHMMATDGAIA